MTEPAKLLLIFCLLFPTIGTAMNDTPPEPAPAQSLKTPPETRQQATTSTPPSTPLSRGQLLYENHCTKCHESQVHIRANRKSKSIADVQAWVSKWQAEEKLEWGKSEITDVTGYLVDRFYHFK